MGMEGVQRVPLTASLFGGQNVPHDLRKERRRELGVVANAPIFPFHFWSCNSLSTGWVVVECICSNEGVVECSNEGVVECASNAGI